MRLSLLVRSAAMGCAVWLGAAGAQAQTGYLTNGGEFAITGPLPGDQVHPALSLSPSGGYLVWQGNDVCPHGLGIGALALDASLHGVGSRFRVNQIGVGDQENPQVTLLNGGGAAFVWQGGRQGFQHIYGRFLTASNLWAAGDQLISASTNRFQQDPALVTLANGNLVVAYSSFNQASGTSMQDVYAQVLSPTGQKVVNEFGVNQFTAFNQRSPAVAALSGGGFVVVWVSELQRSGSPDNADSQHLYPATVTNTVTVSVDVYGRLFDANGAPVGNEFLINTDSSICSHPSVAAAAAGGFVVTWAERDPQFGGNGWDVFARTFAADGTGGMASRVNTFTQGDQYAPRASSLGTNYLLVWTSVGQDGSFEGVYGRFLQNDGSTLSDEFRVNTTTRGRQYQPTVASDGAGRFLTAWAGYSTVSHSQDLFAQAYGLAGFVPGPAVVQYAAPPVEGFIDVPPASGTGPLPPSTLAGWVLPVPPAGSAPTIGSGLAALPGNYNGLFYDTNGVNVLSAGSISVKVTAHYTYSAKLLVGGKSYSVSGQFDATGQDTKPVKRAAGLTSLVVNLQLAHLGSNADEIRGSVKAGDQWQAEIVADRQVFNRSSNKALTYAGQYTVALPPTIGGPEGSGFATLTIDTAGTVRWAASLADGTKLSQSGTLSPQGYWPLYAALYKGQGLITSWVQFAGNSSAGHIIWIKPPGAVAPLFVSSFTNTVDAVISPYSKAKAIGIAQTGSLSFNGGSLNQPLTKALTLDKNGRTVPTSASELNLTLSPSTGLFRGTTSLLSPSGRKITFQGVLLENGLYGAGFFPNNGVSGQVYWSLQ